MEHVSQAVVGDLPSVGERRHDRALGPLLDETIEQLHAELDVGPRDRRPGVVVPRAVARRHLDRRRRFAGVRLRRRPEPERALIRLVRLLEPERHVQRQRELEQHQRDLAVLAPSLQDRQQLAVVTDRLVERVLLTGAVARDREVRDRLVLVVGGQPVVGQQAGDLFLASGVPRLQPSRRLPMQAVPIRGDQRAVRRLLDQRVLEAVFGLGPPMALAHQIQTHQVVQRQPHHALLGPDHGLEQR